MRDYPAWRHEGFEGMPDDFCQHVRSVYECDWCWFEAHAQNLMVSLVDPFTRAVSFWARGFAR